MLEIQTQDTWQVFSQYNNICKSKMGRVQMYGVVGSPAGMPRSLHVLYGNL